MARPPSTKSSDGLICASPFLSSCTSPLIFEVRSEWCFAPIWVEDRDTWRRSFAMTRIVRPSDATLPPLGHVAIYPIHTSPYPHPRTDSQKDRHWQPPCWQRKTPLCRYFTCRYSTTYRIVKLSWNFPDHHATFTMVLVYHGLFRDMIPAPYLIKL